MKGCDYPPQSIRGIILSIQLYLHMCRINWKLLSEDDPIFVDLYNVIDNVMKDHTEQGLGKVNSCSPVTNTMEEEIWNTRVLSEHTPAQLLDTIMYLIGVNYALRVGGNEHHHLRRPGFIEQIRVGFDTDNIKCLKFQANVKSKTNQGA